MNLSFRKAIVTAVAFAAMACMTHGAVFGEEVTRVFLFAGQSNMVGSDAHTDRIDDYPNCKGLVVTHILQSSRVGDEACFPWIRGSCDDLVC